MRSFKTEGYKVIFDLDPTSYIGLERVTLQSRIHDHEVSFTNLPMLTAHLCDQIQNGGMSKQEASKTIAKAMLHLT
jgi:hypothetical protein